MGILRTLFRADDPLRFSELRDRIGMRDSGQFNYHLDKLVGSFVAETDEGYVLSAAGGRVAGSVLSGRYTKSVESDSERIEGTCSHCGESLVGHFERELVRIACEECERNVISLEPPVGAFEEFPREEWPSVAERWIRQTFETVKDGFCVRCQGSMTKRLVSNPADLQDVFPVGVEYRCRRCSMGMNANVEAHLLTETPVIAFHYEHGIDPLDRRIWDLEWPVEPRAEVVAEDPLRVEVPLELGEDRMVVTVDEDAEIAGISREGAR